MKAVIMAGGKGTRIASVNSELPKPMIPILGKPILQYEVEALAKQGITDFIFVVGYLYQKIQDYFGDGSRFGISIQYIIETEPLGTAGSFYYLQKLIDDDFLLCNGDAAFDIDVDSFYKKHKAYGGLATLLTHPNSHPYDSGLIVADSNGLVTKWMTKEEERKWYKNRVNSGIHLISPKLLKRVSEPKKTDLDREILKPLVAEKQLYAYDSTEYVKDMGTPERLAQVTQDISSGLVEARNLSHKQKAIFLDRDGTINKYVGFLRNIDDMELIDGVSSAIKRINESGYLAIVVTNQPVIARGEVTVEELNEIHNKMETLLGLDGAYIDGLYYCPHHPHKGYAGEIPELKFDCECRKPKPGMLLKAAEDFNIDLSHSWMIGDGDNDIEAGKAAGCKTIKLQEGMDLLSAVDMILSTES